jgi:hypothetical protein
MPRDTPGGDYNLKTAAQAAHDASYALYSTGILSSDGTDASNVAFYNLTLNNNLHVVGDFQVDGSMTKIFSTHLDISDGLIELATSNINDTVDIGFYGQYNDGSVTKYTGLYREKAGGDFKLFKGLEDQPNNLGVTSTDSTFEIAELHADLSANAIKTTTLMVGGVNITGNVNASITSIEGDIVDINASISSIEADIVDISTNGQTNMTRLTTTGATTLASLAGVVNISRSGANTRVKGTLNVDETLTVAAEKTTELGGNVTIKGDVDTVAAGAMTLGGSTATSIDIADAGVITTVK